MEDIPRLRICCLANNSILLFPFLAKNKTSVVDKAGEGCSETAIQYFGNDDDSNNNNKNRLSILLLVAGFAHDSSKAIASRHPMEARRELVSPDHVESEFAPPRNSAK